MPNLAEAQQAIGRIIRDGNRAGDVISRMRALFKKAPAAKGPVDINFVIQEVLTLTQSELQKNRVSVRTQFAVDLPIVIGDKIQLQQVILNLVVNAIEAMSGVTENQRELHVSSQKITETHSESGQETIEAKAPTEPDSTSLLIAVRDAGPGLDPTALKHVFETTLSLPRRVGRSGVLDEFEIEGNKEEQEGIGKSVEALKAAMKRLDRSK